MSNTTDVTSEGTKDYYIINHISSLHGYVQQHTGSRLEIIRMSRNKYEELTNQAASLNTTYRIPAYNLQNRPNTRSHRLCIYRANNGSDDALAEAVWTQLAKRLRFRDGFGLGSTWFRGQFLRRWGGRDACRYRCFLCNPLCEGI